MKRKTIVVLCMMAITIAISACGKKNKVDNPVEEVVTEVEEDKADEVVEKLNEADESGLKLDSFKWEGPLHLYIEDLDGIIYHLSDTAVVASGVPCNDDGCGSLLWAARYIDHCSITDDSDPNGPYYCQGFGGSDVWEIRVDEKNNIKSVVDVFTVD